jgi:hypothetical protein
VKHPDPPTRKPYSVPRLVTYGDLRVITENKNRAGADGGSGASSKST